MKIWAVCHMGSHIYSGRYFSTYEKARKHFKKITDEIRYRNVNIVTDTDTEFSFYFGWEENGVTWVIQEIECDQE